MRVASLASWLCSCVYVLLVLGSPSHLGAALIDQDLSRNFSVKRSQYKTAPTFLQGRNFRNYTDNTPTVFLHIVKAGGTSITEALRDKWAKKCVRYTPGQVPSPEAICQWAHLHAGPDGDNRARFVEEAMQGKITPPVRYMAAHQPFGFCTFLERGCKYITVLRDPVDRVLSHFHYLHKVHPGYLDSRCSNCSTVEGFAVELAAGRVDEYSMDNLQTRMIAGDAFWNTITSSRMCEMGLEGCDIMPAVDELMLRKAKANLRRHFAVVGTLEELDKFGAALGFPSFGHSNKGYDYDKTLAPETLALLKQTQSYDIELYAVVERLASLQTGSRGYIDTDESDGEIFV